MLEAEAVLTYTYHLGFEQEDENIGMFYLKTFLFWL